MKRYGRGCRDPARWSRCAPRLKLEEHQSGGRVLSQHRSSSVQPRNEQLGHSKLRFHPPFPARTAHSPTASRSGSRDDRSIFPETDQDRARWPLSSQPPSLSFSSDLFFKLPQAALFLSVFFSFLSSSWFSKARAAGWSGAGRWRTAQPLLAGIWRSGTADRRTGTGSTSLGGIYSYSCGMQWLSVKTSLSLFPWLASAVIVQRSWLTLSHSGCGLGCR